MSLFSKPKAAPALALTLDLLTDFGLRVQEVCTLVHRDQMPVVKNRGPCRTAQTCGIFHVYIKHLENALIHHNMGYIVYGTS